MRTRNEMGGMLFGWELISWIKPAGNESIMSPLMRTWHLLSHQVSWVSRGKVETAYFDSSGPRKRA